MGTRITLDNERNRFAVVKALREVGFTYRYTQDENVVITNAKPREVREILEVIPPYIPVEALKFRTEESEYENFHWFVNFTQGYNPPRRYSVPMTSLDIANSWAHAYRGFGDRRRVSISTRPARGAIVLDPNLEKP